MRMVALGQRICRDGGQARLASVQLDPLLARRVRFHGISIACGEASPGSDEDIRWVVEQAVEQGCDWLAADGYGFDTAFQDAMREAGIRLLLVDDFGHCSRYSADLVLNQNLSAHADLYPHRAERTKLLLGPEYMLLRTEFSDDLPCEAAVPDRARRILVTLGGADPVDATTRVLRALAELSDPSLSVKLVVGVSNRNAARLAETVRDPRIELLQSVEDMTKPMRWADLAISAGGTTALELCFMGVPTMLCVLAANQVELVRSLAEAGICECLGWHHSLVAGELAARIEALSGSPARRRDMAAAGRTLIDGQGSARIVAAMNASTAGRG